MATATDNEPMCSLHEHMEVPNEVSGGERVEEAPTGSGCEPSLSDGASATRLEEDLKREGDVDMLDSYPQQTAISAEADANDPCGSSEKDRETADSGATERPMTALDKAPDNYDGSSMMPECVSDLFGVCPAEELQSPREQVDGSQTQNKQTETHSPCRASRVIDTDEAKPETLEPDARQGGCEGEDPDSSQVETHSDDRDSQSIRTGNLHATDVPSIDDAVGLVELASSAVNSTNSSECPAVTEAKIATASGVTVGVKRAAESPTSEVPEFSWNDILRVQNLIERCLQQYLTKREILGALQSQASVDPAFADVVWQKLEEQNPSFFRAYHIQLRLKEQIVAFNYLVAQQKEMTAKQMKRRHIKTSNATSGGSRRHGGSSGGVCSPSSVFETDESLFAGVSDSAELGQAGNMSASTASSLIAQLPPPSPLPLPSPIKTDLDTHAFFT